MRVAHITPGAGGMYCGSCMHDNTLASALIKLGHEVALIPIYTPVRTDEADVSIDRVFYGAINVYLEQKSALFRHTPRLVDRLLNSARMLEWASSRSSTVDARELGDLTLSMLQGEEGKQRKELEHLVGWLRDEYRPDLVHLSNSMLVGMSRRIRDELKVPVLCSVQGEDIFVDELADPWLGRVRETLRERARDVDAFIATSRYYLNHMSAYLDVSTERMREVQLGIRLEDFAGNAEPRTQNDPFVVGYLARICPEKGLHLLAEAFRQLVDRVGPRRVRLEIAGYLGPRDQAYFTGIMEQFGAWGIEGLVRHHGEVDRLQKVAFLKSLDVLSVPTVYHEPKGLFVLEALASCVPVVQPRHGAFPELIESTGGGVLFDPESLPALTDALARLIEEPERRAAMGRSGRAAVERNHTDTVMARKTVEVYEEYAA